MKAIMGKISVYYRVFLKSHMIYKANVIAKIVYVPINMFIIGFIWYVIYQNNPKTFDFQYMIRYYFITFIVIQVYPFARRTRDIADEIFNGKITNYLIRPTSYFYPQISHFLSWISVYFLMVLPVFIFFCIICRLNLVNITFFIIILAIGLSTNFVIWYSISLLSFWSERILGFVRAYYVLVQFCSGALIPLSLIPNSIKSFLEMLPFKYFVFYPIDILLKGNVSKLDLGFNLLAALAWFAFFNLISQVVWHMGIRRYESNFH